MTLYLVLPLLVAIAILQATLVSRLTVWGVFVDLPVLVVASWGLLRGAREGIVWGFVAGVAVDVLSGAPFGAATLSLMAVGFLAGLARNSVYAAHVVFPLALGFALTIAYSLLFLLVVWISGQAVVWRDTLFRVILPSAMLNAVLMPVVFVLMRLLNTRFSQEEMEW